MSRRKIDEPAKELSPLALDLIASPFRALSEPVRLRLLNLLMQGEHTVGQLVEASGSVRRTSPGTSPSCATRAWWGCVRKS